MYLIPDKFSLYATPSPMVGWPWPGGQLPGKPERTLGQAERFLTLSSRRTFLPPDRVTRQPNARLPPQAELMNGHYCLCARSKCP